MRDARTVIARTSIDRIWCEQERRLVPVFIGVHGADAILAALADAGLVVVPREPPPELCFKILAALPSDWTGFQAEDIKELWRAMVEAANEQ